MKGLSFKLGIVICALLFTIHVNAQSKDYAVGEYLQIVDSETGEPIPTVAVYNDERTKSSISDEDGMVLIDKFGEGEDILIEHSAYQFVFYTKRQLRKKNLKIGLNKDLSILSEVVLSSSRWAEEHKTVPNQIVKIKSQDIAFLASQTSADIISNTGEVYVQKSQLGGGSPMLRGFAANSVLLVVDGIRLNNAIYRSGNLQNIITIDGGSLESTEVLFGPGSVMFGSDALGGVMNFTTIQPKYSDSDKPLFDLDAFTRYSSANNEKTAHVKFNLGYKKIAFSTALTFSDFDDLRSGSIHSPFLPNFGKRFVYVDRVNGQDVIVQNDDPNLQVGTGYSQFNLLQKVKYKAGKNIDLTYGFYFSTSSDIPRYDRLIRFESDGVTPRNAEWYYGPQNWMMHALTTSLNEKTLFFDEAKFTLAYQTVEESRNDRDFQDSTLRTREETVDIATINLDFHKSFNSRNDLYYGIDYSYNQVGSNGINRNIFTGETSPTASRYPSGGSDVYSTAVYTKYTHRFNENLSINAGARYTLYSLSSVVGDEGVGLPFSNISLETDALSGSLGLVYFIKPGWQIYANASSGFRAPNVDDIAKVFESEVGSVVVPNGNLGPEFSYTTEIGISKNYNEKIIMTANTYYTWVFDAIERRATTFNGQDSILFDGELSQVNTNVNVGEAFIYGVSAKIIAKVTDSFSFTSTLTYTEGEDKTNDIPLRHIPPVFGRSTFTYQSKKFRGDFYIDYAGWKRFGDLPPEEQDKTHLYTSEGTPSWVTLNLKTGYQINANLRVNMGLENILDWHYRPFSSGISAPGRNFIISVHAKI